MKPAVLLITCLLMILLMPRFIFAEVNDVYLAEIPKDKVMAFPGTNTIDEKQEFGNRFKISADGVITDSMTRLQWLVGPDQNLSYTDAKEWVENCSISGGNWRMPRRQELALLHQQGVNQWNLNPAFKAPANLSLVLMHVWAEPHDSSLAWCHSFPNGGDILERHNTKRWNMRVFAVRSIIGDWTTNSATNCKVWNQERTNGQTFSLCQ